MEDEVYAFPEALPGINRWSAEMTLIFSLGRADILSFDDMGTRKGLMRLHGSENLAGQVRELPETLLLLLLGSLFLYGI